MAVKQVIVVRRDLRLRRAELASMVAKAATQFFLYNDESDSSDKIEVNLSKTESSWLSDRDPKFVVLGVQSRNAMEKLIFKADVEGIPTYAISCNAASNEDYDSPPSEEIAVLAVGPDESSFIDNITGKLKLL